MDVSRLMRAVLGEAAPTEGKTLELKPGQVVRGIVLQLVAENEALMNVGGVPMRAKLETSIPVGQASLFQVQPDTGSGMVMLKALSASTADIPTDSLVDVLKNFGMKDTPTNRTIVRVLHEEGVPMSRATNAAVAAAVAEVAPQGDAEAAVRAAAIAAKRGLPVTADTVRALHTAMTGPSPSELLRALEAGAREALAAPQTGAAGKQAATRLLEVLQRADALLGAALRPKAQQEGAPPRAAGAQASAAASGAAAGGGHAPGSAPAGASTAQAASAAPAGAPAGAGSPTPSAPGASQTPGGTAPPTTAAASTSAPAGTAPTGASAAAGTPAQSPPAANAPAVTAAPRAEAAAPQASAASTPAETPPRAPERPPLLAFLKTLGVDAEREWLKLSAAPPASAEEAPPAGDAARTAERPETAAARAFRPVGEPPAPAPLPLPAIAADAAPERPSAPLDTLKTVLTQLAAADDVPPALKEAAQTALQSVTGQQLLMAQDRAVPFAHVTMFVPLQGKNGGEDGNAAVHIHTRRGKKGELDADNCRLWFQLSLASLGETWVDVSVVNKIVGLHVWNDHPASETLLAAHKPGMEAALQGIGYQLLTFKHSPKPKELPAELGGAGAGKSSTASAYAPKTYKGVDLRV
ncbi:flagellar hook-length control protein FliK [Paenibacillus sp. TRM 82003]|nr:flagellar hook-length control protein FliK [Paenibacillus sp. TRM 82003]